jgi:endonuclease/exonuclease/phosphatase (EEP) superfamily protein YafD
MIRRLVAALVVVAVAIVLLVLVWPQLLGGQRRQYVAQAVSFRALLGLAALVGGLVLVALAVTARRIRRLCTSLALVLLAFVVVDGGVLASRGLGSEGPVPAPGDGTVTVMAWNTLGDATGPEAVSRIALEEQADVIALPETSLALATEVASAMAAEGRPMEVNQSASGPGTDTTTALLTSTALGEYTVDRTRGDTSRLPTVVAVPTDGSGPTIVAAHPIAPIPRYVGLWQDDLAWLADLCSSGDMIMAGDFNSTVDHFAGLSATADAGLGRCRDAAAITGDAAVGTWPTVIPASVGAPIDHVLATREWDVADMHVVTGADDEGSDHRPIVATLTPSAG